jgi:2,3-dihydroxybenzoate decarboxylase
MDAGGRWFDDVFLGREAKLKVGRNNANKLFSLRLPPLPESLAVSFAS